MEVISSGFLDLWFFMIVLVCISDSYVGVPGPNVRASKGEVWPAPQAQTKYGQYYFVKVNRLKITASVTTCPILNLALERYKTIISSQFSTNGSHSRRLGWVERLRRRCPRHGRGLALLKDLWVEMVGNCETTPHIDMDESYELSVGMNFTVQGGPLSVIHCRSVWGALRGLETFSQLLYQPTECGSVIVNVTYIKDYPRFPHRGLMLDTSRHFISVSKLLQILDAMSYNKLNVFHWHIVDDQSFPYQSKHFPTLSKFGAYHSSLVYTQHDVKYVIEHARVRGIRVVPEFDIPGHTRSWGEAFPIILTQCHRNDTVQLGPMDPTSNYTRQFLEEFFTEVVKLFPDKYIHYGGNEVDYKCWEDNPFIRSFMAKNGIQHVYQLHSRLLQRLRASHKNKKRPIVWQDAANLKSLTTQSDAVIQIWKEISPHNVNAMMASGYHLLFSSCWHVERIHVSWQSMYLCEPRDWLTDPELEELVLGGEACVWSQEVNTHNVVTRTFPRACAAAERLWSAHAVRDAEEAAHRLEEQACRLNDRGLPTQPPNGPGYCV